jgi:hypothetical protein
MIIQEVKMKRGLVVIIILSLAIMAFACGNPSQIDVDAPHASSVVGAVETHSGEIIETYTTPTVEQLLNAALEVEAISSSTKISINIILGLLPELDGWLSEIPDETWQAIDQIMSSVEELETVSATRDFLQDAVDSGNYSDHEWLPEALQFGIDLLDAGENTIYNSGWAPYTEEPLVGFNVSRLWKAGLEGGIAGAVGAALADVAPAQYVIGIGGCIGAVDSSIADFIDQLSDWW